MSHKNKSGKNDLNRSCHFEPLTPSPRSILWYIVEGVGADGIPAQLAFVCYMYFLNYYKRGRIFKGTINHVYVTTDPEMLAK